MIGRRAGARALGLWPELVIVVAVFVAFRTTIGDTAHFPYDAEFFHFPMLEEVQQMFTTHALPSWDADSYGGIPLLANAQSSWLYPPQLVLDAILWLISRPLTQHTQNLVVLAQLTLAGLGTARVARERGLGGAAAAYAGVFVALTGETVSQTEHILMTETLAWVPWGILLVDRMAVRVTAGRIVLLGLMMALVITPGFLPLVPSAIVVWIGAAVARGEGRTRAIGGTVAGMVLGLLFSAAMWLPVGAIDNIFPPLQPHGALPTAGLLSALLPSVFGHWSSGFYDGPGGLTSSYYYLGGAALILIPLAVASSRQAVREAVLVLVLVLGSFGFVSAKVAHLIQQLPTVGELWRPEDLAFAATVPAGLLLARALSGVPRRWAMVGSLVVVLIAIAIPFGAPGHRTVHLVFNAPAITVVMAAVSIAMLTAAAVSPAVPRLRSAPRLVALLLVATSVLGAADLATAVTGRYFVNSAGGASSAGPTSSGDGSPLLSVIEANLQPGQRMAADLSYVTPEWSGFPPVWQISDANGFQPQFSRYQLNRVIATGADFNGANRIFPIVPRLLPYFREMGVALVLVGSAHDPFAHVAGYKMIYTNGVERLYRVPGSVARAHLVDSHCLSRRGADEVSACFALSPRATVSLTTYSSRRFTLGSHPADTLITGEPWYPGWKATSRGHSLPVVRVGYLAALKVPGSVRSLSLSYTPPGLLAGAVISLLSLLGAALALVWPRVAARRGRSRTADGLVDHASPSGQG